MRQYAVMLLRMTSSPLGISRYLMQPQFLATPAQAGHPSPQGPPPAAWRLLLCAAMCVTVAVAFLATAIAASLEAGRYMMALINADFGQDLHCFLCGMYIVWGASLLVRKCTEAAHPGVGRVWGHSELWRPTLPPPRIRHDSHVAIAALVVLRGRVANVLLSLLLCFTGLTVVPLLLGLMADLAVTMPLRVPLDEEPFVPITANWALGVVYTTMLVQFCERALLGLPPSAPSLTLCVARSVCWRVWRGVA